MKFLTAALFMCIALIGQIQGGSLRGLSVIVPHQQYGVPLLSSEIQTEEIKPEIDDKQPTIHQNELVKQEEPTTSKPFIDHLPFVDSVVNFGSPSAGKPSVTSVIQKPELSLLQPGLPSLPAAPIVPLNIEQPLTGFTVEQPIKLNQELSNNYLPPKLELLQPGLPSLPATAIVPLSIEQPIKIEEPNQSNSELTNAIPSNILPSLCPTLPTLPFIPFPNIPLPSLPCFQFPQSLVQSHVQPAATLAPLSISQPIQISQQLSNAYLPPKPSELPLLQPGLPSLPEAPIAPLTIAIAQPIESQADQLKPKPELPLLQPGFPSLPEAPKVPLTIATEQPIEPQAELSNINLPPKPELPLLQPGLPSLPEAPIVPKVTETPALPEAPVTPASVQIIEQSTTGYTYEKPVPAFIENEQLSVASQAPVVDDIKPDQINQAPTLANQPLSTAHIAPGYISSHILDISQASHIQPAQQILVQPSLPVQQVLVQPALHQEQQQVYLQNVVPAQQVLLQPSFPVHQQVLVQPSVPILSELNKAPVEAAVHPGYNYSAPKIEFPLPNQY